MQLYVYKYKFKGEVYIRNPCARCILSASLQLDNAEVCSMIFNYPTAFMKMEY